MIPSTVTTQVFVWKNPEVQRYCVVFVARAVDLLDRGIPFIGSDDVPESEQPASHAIPGSAISALRTAHVIADFWGTVPTEKIFVGRRVSKRGKANGRKVSLFKLTSRRMAVEFLKRNGMVPEPMQMELFSGRQA